MLKAITAFEVRYQLRSPLFWISFALFFLLAFAATTSDTIQIGARGNVNVNSPIAMIQTIAIFNIFALFIVASFVSNVIVRDDETGFAPILRSTLIRKFDYLTGRFIGSFFVACLVLSAVPLAMLIGAQMPWLDPEKLGPTVLWHYIYALLVFGIPTLFVLSAVLFSLATVTRSMVWTYVGAIALLVSWIVSRNLTNDASLETLAAIIDPFGGRTIGLVTKYWTAADKNTLLPPLTDLLLYNRLLWIGIGLLFCVIAYLCYQFEAKQKSAKSDKKAAKNDTPPEQQFLVSAADSPANPAQQFWALTRFDMRSVFKSPAFFVLLGIGLLNALGAVSFVVEVRDVNYLPVTRAIVDALTGSFTIIPVMIAVYYSGDLVWRDHDRRIHEIVDATVAPNWAFFAPKVIAIALVILTTLVVATVCAIAFQLFHGYTNIDLGALLLWFILPNFISALLIAILSIFVQSLVPHKAVGWAVMLIYVVASVSLASMGFEHNLYLYGGSADVPLSDMNRMGHFWIGRAWQQAYWLAFGCVLLIVTQMLWRRGGDTRLAPRLNKLPAKLSGRSGGFLAAACLSWIGIGAWIFYNTNVLNKYSTRVQNEATQAQRERTLTPFLNRPTLTIQHVTLKVDLFPKKLRAETNGSYLAKNNTGKPIDEVILEFNAGLAEFKAQIANATLDQAFPKHGLQVYKLNTAVQPGQSITIEFQTRLEQKGFTNDSGLRRIVDNGTFLDNATLAPFIGATRGGFLDDRAKRRKHNLPIEFRMPKLDDKSADAFHYLRRDSDWVTADLTLSTDADQTPLAPGYTVSDRVEGDRRTLITKTEAPIQNFFSMQSARYAIGKDSWTSKSGIPVALSVYYHPEHKKNVQRILDAMKVSLTVFSSAFSDYQFTQARVLEFPAYESFAQAFAGTVPFSESIGFVQNFDDSQKDSKIDQLTYVTAHEIAHQWWAHQLIGADKQGSVLLSETMAQYSALLVMEKMYGKDQIRKFLKKELDGYLRRRGSDVLDEQPLNRVETQSYIYYQKGSVTMYWLKEVVGEQAVNTALKNLLAEFKFKGAPYPSSADFLRLLRAQVDPKHESLIVDSFEKITLFDLKATDPKVTQRADGQFDVQFIVDAKKMYADGKGKETDAALNEGFDVGVFTVEPGKPGYTAASVLTMQRRNLVSGKQTITLTVAKKPAFVGVDPYNMRIDRNSNDNVIALK